MDLNMQNVGGGGLTQAGLDMAAAVVEGDDNPPPLNHDENRGKGIAWTTAPDFRAYMRTAHDEQVRANATKMVDAMLRDGHTVESLQMVPDLATLHSADEIHSANAVRAKRFPVLYFAYNSAAAGQGERMRSMRELRYASRWLRSYACDLPEALDKADAAKLHFLQQNLPQPCNKTKRKTQYKEDAKKKQRKGGKRKAGARQGRQRPRMMEIGVDSFSAKGRRTTSGFPYMSLPRRVFAFAKTQAHWRSRVRFTIVNGAYTSKTASPLQCLEEGTYADMETVTPAHLQRLRRKRGWGGEIMDLYKYRYNPIAKAVQQRDSGGPADALAVKRMAWGKDLQLFTRQRVKLQKSASKERGGGRIDQS